MVVHTASPLYALKVIIKFIKTLFFQGDKLGAVRVLFLAALCLFYRVFLVLQLARHQERVWGLLYFK